MKIFHDICLGLCYGLLGYSGGLCHTVSLFIVCFPILIVILHYILRRILIDLRLLSLRGLGHRGIAVGAVMLTVVIGGFGVTDDQQLLDVPLKHFFIQNPRAKHRDPVGVHDRALASLQRFGGFLLAVNDHGHRFLLHANGYPMPLPIGDVDRAEQGVVLGGGLPQVVFKQEDGRPPDLNADLLNAVLIVDR